MTPGQLVLRGSERGSAALDLMSNAAGAAPASFEDVEHDVRVPRFGGAALLRAADRALQAGFSVRRIEFGGADDSTLTDETTDAEVSDDVVGALATSGPSGAQGLLRHEYRSYVVCGVQLYSAETRVVTLRRDGVILGKDSEALWLFIHSVLEEPREK
jgi:hypothetical protein